MADHEFGRSGDPPDSLVYQRCHARRVTDSWLRFNEETLEAFPDLGDNWPDVGDPTWDDEIVLFFEMNNVDIAPDFAEMNPAAMWLDELDELDVADLGAGPGEIEDILVNLGTSKVVYVLLEMGDFLEENSYVLAPFTSMDPQSFTAGEIRLDPSIDLETLQAAPRYERSAENDAAVIHEDFDPALVEFWNSLGFDNE